MEPNDALELSPDKIYYFNFSGGSPESINGFIKELKSHGIRALLTIGKVEAVDIVQLINGLSPEYKEEIRKNLNRLDIQWEDASPQRWQCNRCGVEVDMEKKICDCETSPSPWAPIPDNHINPKNHEQSR